MPRTRDRILVGAAIVVLLVNTMGWFSVATRLDRISSRLQTQRPPVPKEAARAQPTSPPATRRGSAPNAPFVDVSPAVGLRIPGISRPVLCPGERVDLPGDTQVVGITYAGESRAYVVRAFEVLRVSDPKDLQVHVVNDVIGDRPVSIAHCNLTHSTRVLRPGGPASRDEPLELGVAGWHNGLLLTLGEHRFPHHSSKVPLRDVPFVTTTWEHWLAEHPETLVYTGRPCQSTGESG